MIHPASVCSRMYALQHIPLEIVSDDGHFIQCWPESFMNIMKPEIFQLVVRDFRMQNHDALHPLVHYLNNGFLAGVIEISPKQYIIAGLASPYRHSRRELSEMAAETVLPEYLQLFTETTIKAPITSPLQMKAYVGLIAEMISGQTIPEENIVISNIGGSVLYSKDQLNKAQFRQREATDEHASQDYENAVCQAVSLGRPDLLSRAIFAPPGGSIGAMSSDSLRQLRYAFISFATLISRAAIQGGLSAETAFLLSDLYCQRMDGMNVHSEIEQLLVSMAMDFCDQVRKNRNPLNTSPVIRKAIRYITVHLHDSFGMEDLSAYCGLCRRSLSLRFKTEVGMSVLDYIQKEKHDEACFLLEHTDLTLTQISNYLNYSSQSYFTQQFKKSAGVTPERYRRQHPKRDDSH